jgi:rhamnogalacturonyl hydrolase YesR
MGYEISKDADWRQDLMAVMGNFIHETGCKTIIVNGVEVTLFLFYNPNDSFQKSCKVSK